jgi:hypothetical protein
MTFNTTDARTDLRPTRHVVIYPDPFWAIAAPRHRAGRASHRAKSAFVPAIRRPSHIAARLTRFLIMAACAVYAIALWVLP